MHKDIIYYNATSTDPRTHLGVNEEIPDLVHPSQITDVDVPEPKLNRAQRRALKYGRSNTPVRTYKQRLQRTSTTR